MKPQDYVTNVLLNENRDFTKLKVRMSEERNIRLLHGAIGLCTEATELFEMLEKEKLDLVNLKEEVADALWYQGVIVDELKLDPAILIQNSLVDQPYFFRFISKENREKKQENKLLSFLIEKLGQVEDILNSKKKKLNKHIDSLVMHVGLMQDLMKKSIFYGKVLNEEKVKEEMISISKEIATLCFLGEVTVEASMEANVKKLAARYKEGKFTEKSAVERDLVKERAILESKQ